MNAGGIFSAFRLRHPKLLEVRMIGKAEELGERSENVAALLDVPLLDRPQRA